MLRFIKTNDEQGCVLTILLSDGVRTITGLRLALALPDAFASSFPSSYILPGWHGDQLTFSFFFLLDSIYPTLSFSFYTLYRSITSPPKCLSLFSFLSVKPASLPNPRLSSKRLFLLMSHVPAVMFPRLSYIRSGLHGPNDNVK